MSLSSPALFTIPNLSFALPAVHLQLAGMQGAIIRCSQCKRFLSSVSLWVLLQAPRAVSTRMSYLLWFQPTLIPPIFLVQLTTFDCKFSGCVDSWGKTTVSVFDCTDCASPRCIYLCHACRGGRYGTTSSDQSCGSLMAVREGNGGRALAHLSGKLAKWFRDRQATRTKTKVTIENRILV